MAGVRNDYGIVPFAEPRGLPSDISAVTAFPAEWWGEDAFSYSFIQGGEFPALIDQLIKDHAMASYSKFERDVLPGGYLFNGTLPGFTLYPEDREKATAMGLEDVRLVFWFDE
jgi:hypothetical protein